MVLRGIKVKFQIREKRNFFEFFYKTKGEANRDYNTDKYACSLAKMIGNWREIWNQRTNNSTNIQFPFGVVQVSIGDVHSVLLHDKSSSYPPSRQAAHS